MFPPYGGVVLGQSSEAKKNKDEGHIMVAENGRRGVPTGGSGDIIKNDLFRSFTASIMLGACGGSGGQEPGRGGPGPGKLPPFTVEDCVESDSSDEFSLFPPAPKKQR